MSSRARSSSWHHAHDIFLLFQLFFFLFIVSIHRVKTSKWSINFGRCSLFIWQKLLAISAKCFSKEIMPSKMTLTPSLWFAYCRTWTSMRLICWFMHSSNLYVLQEDLNNFLFWCANLEAKKIDKQRRKRKKTWKKSSKADLAKQVYDTNGCIDKAINFQLTTELLAILSESNNLQVQEEKSESTI